MKHSAVPSLVAMAPDEVERFFPGELEVRLRALLPQAVFLDPVEVKAQWKERWRHHTPRVLVSGWRTPPVPEDALPAYVCHVAGSVRHLVSRQMLAQGLLVSNWGETAAETVAEGALTLILSALRRSHHFADLLHRQAGWPPNGATGTRTLFGRRVSIFGFGAVAKRLVHLLQPFRVEIRAHTVGVPPEVFSEYGVTAVSDLDELICGAEVFVIAESYTPRQRQIFDATRLARLDPDTVFVNVARGGFVDESALAALAREGRLRVALDVYETEPLPASSPLRELMDVVLFPHVAGPTDDVFPICGEAALQNLSRYLEGEQPLNLVTPEVYDRST